MQYPKSVPKGNSKDKTGVNICSNDRNLQITNNNSTNYGQKEFYIPKVLSMDLENQTQQSGMKSSTEQVSQRFEQSIHEKEERFSESWHIGEKVGRGATSQVYRAFNKKDGKTAAVKKIRMNEFIINSQLDILTKLNHPNIVSYYGFNKGLIELEIYMEFIPTTLQSIYQNFGGAIPYENIRRYTRQLVEAVKYIHQLKIIHKDIKCSNILLDQKGIIKLSDFGSSKQFNQSTSAAAYLVDGALTFKGSVLWMAPQVIKDQKFRRKSDIWSIGCTCLEMATGKFPWSQKNFDNELRAIYLIGTKEEIPEIPKDLPCDLQDFIKKCLVRDPDQRNTAQDLLKTDFLKGK